MADVKKDEITIGAKTKVGLPVMAVGAIVIAVWGASEWMAKGTGDRWPCHRQQIDRAQQNLALCEADLLAAGAVPSVRFSDIKCGNDPD